MNFCHDPLLHQQLLYKAEQFTEELLAHPVLKNYRQSISIVLKGSTAHGYSDRHSDIDLVIYCPDKTKEKITGEYVRLGLSQRTDGVFLPLHDWEGHYNLDCLERLSDPAAFSDCAFLWECFHLRLMHDPGKQAEKCIALQRDWFSKNLDQLIYQTYLEYQLQLDWLRQPLRRGDLGAAFLYASSIYRLACRLLFLLKEEPYPCDKWLPFYFSKLELPQKLKHAVENYPELLAQGQLVPGQELAEYPLYRWGSEIIHDIQTLLQDRFGNQPWIEEWYLYA